MVPLKSPEEPEMETSNESTVLQIEHDTLQEVIYVKNVNYEVIHHGGMRGWGSLQSSIQRGSTPRPNPSPFSRLLRSSKNAFIMQSKSTFLEFLRGIHRY